MRSLLALFTVALAVACASTRQEQSSTAPVPAPQVASKRASPQTGQEEDPYLWLEEVDGAKAMGWVKEKNAVTERELGSTEGFLRLRDEILEVMDSKDKIPFVERMGDKLYNFWKDKEHPRGLWRRTTLAEYQKASPKWEVLVDVDALGKAEKESWVWHGESCLKPQYRHCLVFLSRGGADASVMREYDLSTKTFAPKGFSLPEAKSNISWVDANTLFVGTDFGPDSMTTSSYPRIAKLWKRGTPLSQAELVYEGKPTDMAVSASHDATPDFERDLVTRQVDFYTTETYLRGRDGKLTLVDVPRDAMTDVQFEWLLIKPRTPWNVSGKAYPAGALLAARLDDFMAGRRALTVLFTPDAHTSLTDWSWTRHHLILNLLKDVSSRVDVLTPGNGEWKRAPLADVPALSTVEVHGTDPDRTDEYFQVVTGFLTPTTLSRGVMGKEKGRVLKHLPAFFNPQGLTVSQMFAKSKDGTSVPYFVIARKDLPKDGNNPTLLYGYGGFEVSLTPSYSGSTGRTWLSRGGVFALANIRGGGEYGPDWHLAAIKANRLRAYEDFAAVAEDLIAKKVTSREHLGIQGGSNGGLLMGNMLTLYPQLFKAVVCQVPLLDMKRYTRLSAGTSWIAEYGDPEKPEEWSFIKTFSPYQNLKRGAQYPAVLFTTSTRDDRVGPVHARKMAAKMMDLGNDARIYENVEGGHGAAADNRQAAFMSALAYQFLWSHLGGRGGGLARQAP